MRRETQLTTSMEEQNSVGYRVHLKAQEQTAVVLEVDMLVASRDMAQRIRDNREDVSGNIYSFLLANLLKENSLFIYLTVCR